MNKKITIKIIFASCFLILLKSNLLYSNQNDDSLYLNILRDKKIAIIPPQIIIASNDLKNASSQDIKNLETCHMLAYQQELEICLNDMYLNKFIINNMQFTNQRLKDSGIDLQIAWSYSKERLCKVLNVNAIIILKIKQEKAFSNFENYNVFLPDLYSRGLLPYPIVLKNSVFSKKDITGYLEILTEDKTLITLTRKIKSKKNSSTKTIIHSLILDLIKKNTGYNRQF